MSLNGNVDSPPHVRQMSMHGEYPDESSHSLGQQVDVRDQIIASLRAEQSKTQAIHERLDTKSQRMDRELAALVEEKFELRIQVSLLSAQLEKSTREREALQTRSQADAAQWRQIMSMSSELQMQSVEETRQFMSEREAWARERKELQSRLGLGSVRSSTDGTLQRSDTLGSPDVSTLFEASHRPSSLKSTPEEHIQPELDALYERCRELEQLLSSILKESASIERAGKLMEETRRRLGTGLEDQNDQEGKRVRF